jgi:hypothetical protein
MISPALVDDRAPGFDRRSFLRLVRGATALGLTAAHLSRVARADGKASPRFVFVYTPAGREPSWRTGTAGTSYTLGPTMTMFEPVRSKVTIIEGLTSVNFQRFNAHWGSLHCLLGGQPPALRPGNSGGLLSEGSQRTFDHLLGDRLGKGTPVKNVVLGGADRNNEHGSLLLSWSGPRQAQPPIHPPDRAFAALFGGGNDTPPLGDATDAEAQRRVRAWEQEVLGLARGQTRLLKARLGTAERTQLDAYEANLDDALKRVAEDAPALNAEASASCKRAPKLDDFMAGLPTAHYQRHHDLQSRILAAALACGRTRVSSYVMAGIRSGMSLPGGRGSHHLHDDRAVGHYRAYDTYYGHRIKFLMDELAKYPEGNGTVLDSTIIVWMTDISWTPTQHDHDHLPVQLFGGLPGGKLKMGHYVKLPFSGSGGRSNPRDRRLHEVLLTLAGAVGIDDLTGFADARYVQGPIRELLR